MPKENANTFSRQMQAFVTIPLKYFSQFAQFSNLRIITRIFPSFRWGIFRHVKLLNQSPASENIWYGRL